MVSAPLGVRYFKNEDGEIFLYIEKIAVPLGPKTKNSRYSNASEVGQNSKDVQLDQLSQKKI